jgi:hypothetical protein
MSLFRCLVRTKVSVRVFVCEYFVRNIRFHSEELLAPPPTPRLEDHFLSAVRYCLFNIFAATLHTGGCSSPVIVSGVHRLVCITDLINILVLLVVWVLSGVCK